MSQQSLNGKPFCGTILSGETFTLGAEQGFKRITFLPLDDAMTLETTVVTKVVDLDNPNTLRSSTPIVIPAGVPWTLSINDNELLDNWKITAGAGGTVIFYGII